MLDRLREDLKISLPLASVHLLCSTFMEVWYVYWPARHTRESYKPPPTAFAYLPISLFHPLCTSSLPTFHTLSFILCLFLINSSGCAFLSFHSYVNCRFSADNQNHNLACSSLFLSSSISVSLSLPVTCTHSDSLLKLDVTEKNQRGKQSTGVSGNKSITASLFFFFMYWKILSGHSDRGMSISRRKDLLQIIWSYIVCEELVEMNLFKWETPDYYTVKSVTLKGKFILI